MFMKPKKTLGQRLIEDVTSLGKAKEQLGKDNDTLKRKVENLERTVSKLLQHNKKLQLGLNRVRQDAQQTHTTFNTALQAIKRKINA